MQSYLKHTLKQPSSESIAIWRTPSHCMKEIKCSRDQVDLARHALLKYPWFSVRRITSKSFLHIAKTFSSISFTEPNALLGLILDSGPHGFWRKVAQLSHPSNHSSVLFRTDKKSLTTALSSSETGSRSPAASFRAWELFAGLTRPLWSAIANFEVRWNARPW